MKPLPEQPLVSIVMPVYGAEQFLKEAVDSVLNQSYTNIELLVADDASKDSSRAMLDGWDDPRIIRLHNEENQGYLKTCNKLLLAAKGDLVTFHDADDGAPLNRLEKQVAEFLRDAELGMCSTNYILTNIDGSPKLERNWEIDYAGFKGIVKPEVLYCGATIMVRKEVLEDIGVYREFFNRLGAEDFDWLYRIIEKYKAIHLPEHLYYYRQHPSPVKVMNTHIRKYFAHNLVHFLREERLRTGTDALMGGDSTRFEKQVAEWEAPFHNDPTHILRIESQRAINNGVYGPGFKLAFQALGKRPLNSSNYVHLLRMLYAASRKIVMKE